MHGRRVGGVGFVATVLGGREGREMQRGLERTVGKRDRQRGIHTNNDKTTSSQSARTHCIIIAVFFCGAVIVFIFLIFLSLYLCESEFLALAFFFCDPFLSVLT